MATFTFILVFQLVIFLALLGALLWIGLRISQNSPVNIRRALFITVIVAMVAVMVSDAATHGFSIAGYYLLPVIVILVSLAMLVQIKK
ncbi:hypothetical protein [Geomicrobium sp. JCM 19039]|uniref:hypothetical protein n=1 Tax=Geomicrobium sp. JCM 19039 TaxID=1460636 RepID=UPI00045F13FC|nr:hypothetical protein [Geomicrobium sp. JCM 19039]GAK13182.1 hypothetical protein JCM19039_3009 [Geomicrobium sp. JCM 19039]